MSTRAVLLLLAVASAAVVASGCGGSGGGSDPITVKTGSLTKAEFVNRADGICAATRNQFARDFGAYFSKHQALQGSDEEAWLEGIAEKALLPNYEERMIPEISALGAPPSEKQAAVAFLESMQKRLDEIKETPKELNKTPFPFKATAAVAKKYGLEGCAESFH